MAYPQLIQEDDMANRLERASERRDRIRRRLEEGMDRPPPQVEPGRQCQSDVQARRFLRQQGTPRSLSFPQWICAD